MEKGRCCGAIFTLCAGNKLQQDLTRYAKDRFRIVGSPLKDGSFSRFVLREKAHEGFSVLAFAIACVRLDAFNFSRI